MFSPLTTQPTHPAPYIIHPSPSNAHKHTLILLHGTSTSSTQFAESFLSFPIPFPTSSPTSLSSLPELNPGSSALTTLKQIFPATRFVFPTGSLKTVRALGLGVGGRGRECNAWFDFSSFSDRTLDLHLQIEGMRESVGYLSWLVKEEIGLWDRREGGAGIGRGKGKVVLGGFSQGAAIAVLGVVSGVVEGRGVEGGMGIGPGVRGIAGLVELSGYLPLRGMIEEVMAGNRKSGDMQGKRRKVLRCVRGLLGLDLDAEIDGGESKMCGSGWDIPIFLAHGEEDVKMKFSWGEEMTDTLVELGMSVVFKSYPGLEHWYSAEEMVDMVEFLRGLGIE